MGSFNRKQYNIGIGISLLMIAFYLIVKYGIEDMNRSFDGFFLISSITTAVYFISTLIKAGITHKGRFWKVDKSQYSVTLSMLCIGAYTLNLTLPVFDDFSLWVEISLFIILAPLLLHGYRDKMSKHVKTLLSLLSGFGIILSLYFTIFLLPILPISFVAILFFGLGFHLFAPILLFTKLIIDSTKFVKTKAEKAAFIVAIAVPLLVTTGYLVAWKNVRSQLHEAHANAIQNPNNELDDWVLLSQNLSNDYFTETIIKGSIYYSTPEKRRNIWNLSMNGNNIVRQHDPLIYTAFTLFGELPISDEDRYKILNAQYAKRHETTPKLWSEENLRTVEVVNNIALNPAYRFAYTEKKITIKNTNPNSWPAQEEALYSFHLPEGAIVSSLSLWVNGVERHSRLSTKKKATQAYSNIVGVQRRDPAIALWQEGNRVTVNVFPCTKSENRVFKIGITTPLTLANNQLVYENFYFEGPALKNTKETTKLTLLTRENLNIELPSGFKKVKSDTYEYTGTYRPDFIVNVDLEKLSNRAFCFNGSCYKMSEQSKTVTTSAFNNIYLDINQSMDEVEFNSILDQCQDKVVFAFQNEWIKITNTNKSEVFEQLHQKQFSLFPLHQIKTKSNLIVTKSSYVGPNLRDLKGSKFKDNLNAFLGTEQEAPKIYSLNKLSDYFSSLNQLQIVNVHYGSAFELNQVLKGHFPSKSNNENIVYLDNANVQIEKLPEGEAQGAPDHLLRMFGFNQLMKKIGPHFYNSNQYEDELFSIANEAFILSPISSMIVLETDKDYDDNKIDENKNSLKNASMNSSGAVPEPHEWALIVVAVLSLLFLYRNRLRENLSVLLNRC